MLKISYTLKGLHLNEPWFASKVPTEDASLLDLYCYRDSTVDSDTFGLKKEKKYTLTHDLTQDEEDLFSSFKSNVRNEIRKHSKIENFVYHADFKSKTLFIEFYKAFAKAKGLASIEARSIDKYGENLFYIYAYLEEELTNMQVYIMDEESGTIRLLHSISTLYDEQHDKQKQAKIGWINRYLHWYTMLHFKKRLFKTFDWGGYTNDPDSPLAGIDKFKASFGGKKTVLYDYYSLPYYAIKVLKERSL